MKWTARRRRPGPTADSCGVKGTALKTAGQGSWSPPKDPLPNLSNAWRKKWCGDRIMSGCSRHSSLLSHTHTNADTLLVVIFSHFNLFFFFYLSCLFPVTGSTFSTSRCCRIAAGSTTCGMSSSPLWTSWWSFTTATASPRRGLCICGTPSSLPGWGDSFGLFALQRQAFYQCNTYEFSNMSISLDEAENSFYFNNWNLNLQKNVILGQRSGWMQDVSERSCPLNFWCEAEGCWISELSGGPWYQTMAREPHPPDPCRYDCGDRFLVMVTNNHFLWMATGTGSVLFPEINPKSKPYKCSHPFIHSFIHSSQKEVDSVHVWREQQSPHPRNTVEISH